MAQTKDGALKVAAKKAGISLDEFLAKVKNSEKRCSRCGQWKNIALDFGKDTTRHDGRDAACFECRHVKERVSTKGRISAFKGQQHTPEARRKMSEARKGKPNPRKGQPRTLEERAKISRALRASQKVLKGEACHSYKDGKLAERRDQRFSRDYKRWRFDVFMRDKFTCQECRDNRGGNLAAHHIKPFADHAELRFDVSNGITLCETCHYKKHTK